MAELDQTGEEGGPRGLALVTERLGEFLIVVAGSIVLVGVLGIVIAALRGHRYSPSVANAYYFTGCIVFLAGSFPSGGFSVFRGRSRRRPMGGGAFAIPAMLLGVMLIGIGALVDIVHPF